MGVDSPTDAYYTPPAPAPTAPKTTTATKPATDFISLLLAGLGAPLTTANKNFLAAWINREGGGGLNNPLNTTQRMTGSTSFNSVGVQNYTSIATGVQATLKTMLNGRYTDVLAALKAGNANTNTTYKGLGTWSGNGYTNLAGVSTTYKPLTSSATATSTSTSSPTASAGTIKDQVAKKYGYLSSFLDDKEIGPLLIKAVQQDWDQSRMQGALTATKWWKTHSDTTRAWDAQSKTDPATQRSLIQGQVAELHAQMRQLGLIVDPKRLAQMAVNSLRFGWNAQQIRNSLVNEGKFDMTGKSGSYALTLRDNLKARAAQYLVPIDAHTMGQWVRNVEKGEVSENDFDGYLKEQAKSLFPSMGAAIDAGVTPQTYVAPYASIARDTLELPDAAINFTDPKWSKALFQVDPKTGTRTAMSLSDWQNTLRTDPAYGYDKTGGAKAAASDLTTRLAKTFGALG